jgi:hypothetical protein
MGNNRLGGSRTDGGMLPGAGAALSSDGLAASTGAASGLVRRSMLNAAGPAPSAAAGASFLGGASGASAGGGGSGRGGGYQVREQ